MAVLVAPAQDGPDAAALAELQSLYDSGRYLAAHAVAARFGDPRRWRSPAACLLAARLVRNLGGGRVGQELILRAWRRGRPDLDIAFYHAIDVLERHGPLRAWELLSTLADAPDAAPLARANLILARSQVLTAVRDFSAAGAELDRAEAIAPGHLFTLVDRAAWLAAQDRREEALAVARDVLGKWPHYRIAAQLAAGLLEELGRRDEALALLDDTAQHIESCAVVLQRAAIEKEQHRYADAWRSYQQAARLMPCIDERSFRWLCGACSSAAYFSGDIDAAIRFARASQAPVLERMADRLAAAPPPRRVVLAVPFVRQNHLTCGPATLASVAAFHGVPARHVDIVEAICFDGTTSASERRWAEEQGFTVRELTVGWDAAVALIDAGLPFTLTTQEATSAHLQAVVGYDARRRSFVIRDPSVPNLVEVDVDAMLAAQAWTGMHGMVPLPPGREPPPREALPDSELFDHAYAVEQALRKHDHTDAAVALATLGRAAPDHEVTARAEGALANYDGDALRQLAVLEAQLTRHPDAVPLKLRKLSALRGLAQNRARMAMLEEIVAEPDADPLFGRLLGEDLLEDERQIPRAERLLRRSIRGRPLDSSEYFALAWLELGRRRWDQARTLFRFAACLDDTRGDAAMAYFSSCRQVQRTDEAVDFLRQRFARRGRRFAEPGQTLSACLDILGHTAEALAVLDDALAARPDDQELRLHVAVIVARRGRGERARALLDEARPRAKPLSWLRAAATLDLLAGDLPAARARHEHILSSEPLALDVHEERLRLIAAIEGRPAARRAAEAAAARFPHHRGLARLRVDWTDDEGEAGLDAVRALLVVAPDDAWAHRELALRLGQRHRFAEAQAALAEAAARDPRSAATHGARGFLAEWQGRRAEAVAAHRAALAVDIDHVASLRALPALHETAEERRRELAFLRDELGRQVTFGPAVEAYREAARNNQPAEEILLFLEELQRARRDLPATWTALVAQLAELGRDDEARRLARAACLRFALRPEPWLALAQVCERARDIPAQRVALEEAVALAPESVRAVALLAELHHRSGDPLRARALLERASARAPLELWPHGALAEVLWDLGEKDAALARVELALRTESDYAWGWEQLDHWSALAGERGRAVAFARQLAAERPLSAWAHYGLATLLSADREFDERLAALDAALALAPRLIDAYDARATLLTEVGRFDEALQACAPAALGEHLPLSLRGRAAWIEWQRGEGERAVERMTALLADAPQYRFALASLFWWRRERGENALAREMGRKLLALELDAASTRLGLALLEMEIEDRQLDDAARTLARLGERLSAARLRAPSLWLATARYDDGAALEILDAMAEDPDVDLGSIAAAAEVVWNAGFHAQLSAHAERRSAGSTAYAYVWARFGSERSTFSWWSALRRLESVEEVGRAATLGYVERFAREGSGAALWTFMRLHRRRLSADTQLWGRTGLALVARRWWRAAERWVRGWRRHPGATAWMLLNTVLALRCAGDDAEAHEVSLAALALPADGAVQRHQRWLALDAALAAPLDEAQRAVATTPGASRELDHLLLATARAALAARDPDLPGDLRPAVVRALLQEAREQAETLGLGPFVRRLHRRVRAVLPSARE